MNATRLDAVCVAAEDAAATSADTDLPAAAAAAAAASASCAELLKLSEVAVGGVAAVEDACMEEAWRMEWSTRYWW